MKLWRNESYGNIKTDKEKQYWILKVLNITVWWRNRNRNMTVWWGEESIGNIMSVVKKKKVLVITV